LSFFMGQVLLMHPFTVPIWLLGIVWLIRQPRHRALGLAFIVLFIEFVVMKGKIYYLAPAYPMLFAAGAIALPRQIRVPAAVLLIIGGALLAPFAIPILPVETFIRFQ